MTAAQDPAEAWVLLLQSDGPEVLAEAAAMAAAAVSLGIHVTLIWFGGALEALASGRLDVEASETGRGAGPLLREARESGLVRSLACSAAFVQARVDRERVREKVDAVVGWPTAISLIRSAQKSFVW